MTTEPPIEKIAIYMFNAQQNEFSDPKYGRPPVHNASWDKLPEEGIASKNIWRVTAKAAIAAMQSSLCLPEPVIVEGEMDARDWPEDFKHENGNYQNLCCECGRLFFGYKRRVVCRSCVKEKEALAKTEQPVGLSQIERGKVEHLVKREIPRLLLSIAECVDDEGCEMLIERDHYSDIEFALTDAMKQLDAFMVATKAPKRESAQPDESVDAFWRQIVQDLDLAHSWILDEDIGKEFNEIWDKHGKEITEKLLMRESGSFDRLAKAIQPCLKTLRNAGHNSDDLDELCEALTKPTSIEGQS